MTRDAGHTLIARPVSGVEKLAIWVRRYPVVSALATLLILSAIFTLGGLFQYANVLQQRDRATLAEHQTQRLLAQEAAHSGDLAFRRGHTKQAVVHFENALSRGIDTADQIKLKLAECHIINGRFDSAASFVAGLTDSDERDNQAKRKLIQCQLALLGREQFGSATELLNAIDMSQLNQADQHYVLGLRAQTSADALEHFKMSLEHDTYHHSARRASLVLALSLADFDYVADVVSISQQLFPDDDDFELFDALAVAASGDLSDAHQRIERTKFSRSEKRAWIEFADFANEVCQSRQLSHPDDEFTYRQMTKLILDFQQDFAPLVQQRQWFLPPSIQTKFTDYLEHIQKFHDAPQPINPFHDIELAVVLAHSESTLNTLIARRMLLHRGSDKDNLLLVQQLFETAFKSPGFIRDARWQAQMGTFASAIFLTQIHKHEVEQNSARTLEVLEELDPAKIHHLGQLRTMTIFSINHQRWKLASKFAAAWLEQARRGDDAAVLQNALWHQAVVFKNEKNWEDTIRICNELLMNRHVAGKDDRVPASDLAVRPLRQFAIKELRKSTDSAISDSVFAQLVESALAIQNWTLANQVLKRWTKIIGSDGSTENSESERIVDLYRQISAAGQAQQWAAVRTLLKKLESQTGPFSAEMLQFQNLALKGDQAK